MASQMIVQQVKGFITLRTGLSLEGLSEGTIVVGKTRDGTTKEIVTSITPDLLRTVARVEDVMVIRQRQLNDYEVLPYNQQRTVINKNTEDPLERQFYETADKYLESFGE